MKYDIVDLKLLIAIAEAGSVTTAASACFLAPSSASLRLRNLEDAVGTSLFERHARGVTPTEAGHSMLGYARTCVQLLQAMNDEMASYASGLKSQLRLFSNCTAAASVLLDDLQPFLQQHPNLRISLEEHPNSDIASAVAAQRADLGILVSGIPHPDLEYQEYRNEELAVVASPGHPIFKSESISFFECLKFPMVGLPPTAPMQRYLHSKAQALGMKMDVRMQVSCFASVLRLVAAGVGVAILPVDILTPRFADQCQTVKLTDAWARRKLLVCRSRDSVGIQRSVHALSLYLSNLHRQRLPDLEIEQRVN
ncbi:LysR family transcriptional regulator [Roseateles amylovorans]|uniref:LysR family transcriptional regulator n=1 Tax=Roseateles amylovorans TaxID=2978473 RepID=A0ABY6B8U4_9BURK|nr:LysR family transcriptional regulator [Roseateles amylovorans]UXH80331.1 LysR family transcriptional regulator [Roseateles amylovorans]